MGDNLIVLDILTKENVALDLPPVASKADGSSSSAGPVLVAGMDNLKGLIPFHQSLDRSTAHDRSSCHATGGGRATLTVAGSGGEAGGGGASTLPRRLADASTFSVQLLDRSEDEEEIRPSAGDGKMLQAVSNPWTHLPFLIGRSARTLNRPTACLCPGDSARLRP